MDLALNNRQMFRFHKNQPTNHFNFTQIKKIYMYEQKKFLWIE